MINLHINNNANGARVATLMLGARAINPMSRRFQRELDEVLGQLEAQRDELHGVVIGFDDVALTADHELEHLLELTPAQAGDCMQMLTAYNALLRRLEQFGKPVIAALSGAMNGHVFGLALACHCRLSLAGTTVSMPRVALGLTPSIGAIARITRLIGLQAALPLVAEAQVLDAAAARQAGLLHAVAQTETELAEQVQRAIAAGAPALQPWDAKGFRIPGGAPGSPPLQTLLQVAPAMLREKTRGHYPAPEAVLCALVEGAQVDFDNALLIESRYFCQVALGQVAKHMMRLHLATADLEAAPAREFAATLAAAYRQELQALRADGVSMALVRNAALAAGMADVPELAADAGTPPRPAGAEDGPAAFADVRDRLLYVQAVAALHALPRGLPASAAEADAISVRAAGFPAFTGGVAAFARTPGFGARAAALAAAYGARFAPPPGW